MTPPSDRSLDVALVAQNVRSRDGQGQVMLELGRVLIERGHLVTVYAHSAEELDCTLRWVPRVPLGDMVDNIFFYALASARLARTRHDICVVMGACAWVSSPWAYYAQFSQPGWMQTWTPATTPRLYHRAHTRMAQVFERIGAHRADALIACSQKVADDIGAQGPSYVVPNGVRLADYPVPKAGERAAARARWGLQDDAKVIGIIGEYRTGRKGHEPLMEAISASGDEQLLIAGDGDRDQLMRVAGRLGIADRVHAIGFAPARDVIVGCDIVAIPSYYEPFSIVALEAAATERPVIITRTAGAAPHLVGSAVPIDTPTAVQLRQALDELWAGGPEGLAQRGRLARREVERLDWSLTAAQAADIVEKVAVSPG